MSKVKITVLIVFTLALIMVAFLSSQYDGLSSPLNLPSKGLNYRVKSGVSLKVITTDLFEQDVLEYPDALYFYERAYARLFKETIIKTGEYHLAQGLTPLGLLKQLQEGKVVEYQITFVEGWTYKDVLLSLSQQNKIKQELSGFSSDELIKALQIKESHLEGLFFPETYQYYEGLSDKELLIKSYELLQKVLAEEWQNREKGLPYKTPYEALIMASIVEKETGVAEERSKIAGVFVRRLKKHMRLQTDPTVIYGLGDKYKGNITRKHLRQPTDYNTYVIRGLPPTPIALAGREAIHAALHPAKGKELYFVSMGDGRHYFSVTLSQHQKAVRKYQRTERKKNYRSSP